MADEAAMPKEAMLYEKLTGQNSGKVLCRLCMRYCIIGEGERGYCLVRRNVGGKLYSLNYGKSSGFEVDPIEKKPFFHFKPFDVFKMLCVSCDQNGICGFGDR